MVRFLLLSLAWVSVVVSELTGNFLAKFESKATDGASGWFQYVVNSKNVGTYSWNIDLNDFVIPAAAVTAGCTMDIIEESGLKYHIHTDWDNTTDDSSNICGTGSSGCQGHYDPFLACSTTSQNYGSLCTDLNRTSGFYTYGCNSTAYSEGHVALCEVGDLSGKLGAMKQASSDDYTFTDDSVIDVNPPPALYHGDTNDVVSETPWNSIVFHCPVTTSPRLFCAKLVAQDYTEDDDINTMSNNADDDGDSSKYAMFKTVAIVFTVLTGLLIAVLVWAVATRRRDSKKTLLSNNV